MTSRAGVGERPSLAWFCGVGLALFALSSTVIALVAPYPRDFVPATMFLTLCLPRAWVAAKSLTASGPNEWELYGRDGMARVHRVEETSTDDVGAPYYTVTASLTSSGKPLSIKRFQYPDSHGDVIAEMDVLPVHYLPETGRAEIRTDLIGMVLDCADPLETSSADRTDA